METFKTLLALGILSISSILTAQTQVIGTVRDADAMALEFADITIMDTISQMPLAGTSSDEKGNFTLSCNKSGVLQVKIQYLGYEDYSTLLQIDQLNDLGEITLKEAASDLGVDVVVTAARKVIERKEDKIIFNVTSSPLNDNYDGIELLQRSPSLWLDQDENLLTRNGAPMVLINGRPTNLSGEALTNYLRNLRSENIQSIEIQTNPGVNMDAENTGGVVNIILKKKPTGFNANLRSYYNYAFEGFYNTSGNLRLNYGAENWNIYSNLSLSGRRAGADIITDIDYQDTGNYLRTEIDFGVNNTPYNGQLGFVVTPWKNHEIGAEYFRNKLSANVQNVNSISLTNQQDTLDFGALTSENIVNNTSESRVINYAWYLDTLNSSFKIIGDQTLQKNQENISVASTYNLGVLPDIKDRNLFNNQSELRSIQADFVKNFLSGLKIESGAKFIDTRRQNRLLSEDFIDGEWIENNRSSALNYDERILAGYFSISKKVSEKQFLKAGLRSENTELDRLDLKLADTLNQNYTNWFPSFFYSYELGENINLAFNYSRRLNRPSFRDLNNVIIKVNDFRYLIGNPDLTPEIIDQFELSFQRKKQTWSLYYNIYDNAINGVYFLEDDIAFYQRQNNGKQTQYGIEYNLNQKVNDWWTFRSNVNLYHRKFTTEDGIDMFERTTIDLSFSSNFKLDKTTGIDLSARYLSPREDAFYEQIPYYFVQFFIKKSFFDKKLNCRLYFNDPLDLILLGNKRSFEEIVTTFERKNRTRTISFWASYNFNTKNKAQNKSNKADRDSRRRL